MTATLAELLNPQTVEQLFTLLLATYQSQGFPTNSWQVGGVDRTRTMAIATALQDISANYIPSIAAGGLLDYAELLANPAWIQLLAEQNFGLPYNEASFTLGNATLTAGSAGYTVAAGQLVMVFPASGNRYINTSGGVLAPSGTLVLTWTSEFPGAKYNDPSNATISLVTPALPGVVITNPAGSYSDVAHVGAGTGTLTLGGSPVGSHQIIVSIDTTGASGVASWSYSIDGTPFVSAGAVASATNLGGYGINVTLVDGGSGTSFVDNDTYLFNTPGSWITTQGSDDETPTALATRCRNRWASLSSIPTASYYELLATSTPSVGSQVTQVIVLPDADINNKVNVVVAGAAGALPVGVVAAIQTYINARSVGTDYPTVVSPSTTGITIVATVTVSASLLAAAQGSAQTAMNAYVIEAAINPTYRLAVITELLMEIGGVIDVSGVTINGVAANLTLGSSTTFVVGTFTAANLTWITV